MMPSNGLPIFLSTPSARRATDTFRFARRACPISIHALREEGDLFHLARPPSVRPISIHALREEGDSVTVAARVDSPEFLSTPSARRATLFDFCRVYFQTISIHALREEGDVTRTVQWNVRDHISIHALREEGDLMKPINNITSITFLSTPSARRATAKTEKNISAFVSL